MGLEWFGAGKFGTGGCAIRRSGGAVRWPGAAPPTTGVRLSNGITAARSGFLRPPELFPDLRRAGLTTRIIYSILFPRGTHCRTGGPGQRKVDSDWRSATSPGRQTPVRHPSVRCHVPLPSADEQLMVATAEPAPLPAHLDGAPPPPRTGSPLPLRGSGGGGPPADTRPEPRGVPPSASVPPPGRIDAPDTHRHGARDSHPPAGGTSTHPSAFHIRIQLIRSRNPDTDRRHPGPKATGCPHPGTLGRTPPPPNRPAPSVPRTTTLARSPHLTPAPPLHSKEWKGGRGKGAPPTSQGCTSTYYPW